ncbi:MAG: DUF5916 domain-containing protein [Bacteroidetes bacterium]|nr:DUF5916 domain-containing protein [Bacteroidota bacterium]
MALVVSLAGYSQKINESYRLIIRKISTPVVIDGVADEKAWQEADVATDFYMISPMDTSFANVRTDVQMAYDDNNIYLIAVCYHGLLGPYFVESLRRDFSFVRNDNFIFGMDTFDDQTNGFTFGANAAGAQWDGTLYEGGRADLSWDNKWNSVVKSYEDKYIFEMALPFKSIRYKRGISEWGINFSRLDLKTTEKSSWAPVPRQFPSVSLAYTGILAWDQPPPPPVANVSIIPYTLGRISKDHENGEDAEYKAEFGGDAKIAVSSSLNLDLTINPDFSQVDVDQQVTNLDRFELFFPERRQFFLENGDLFSNFGYERIRPFFSRRIGLGVPIQFGARLSGKIDRNWRIGVMNMQTEKVESKHLNAHNFSAIALQRQVFSRSNISLLVVNKQAVNYKADPTGEQTDTLAYNRNIGLEYNLASSNNEWTGKALVMKSFRPGSSGKEFTHAANLNYNTQVWDISWQHEYVGENYSAEAGFVPRKNFVRINPTIAYNFYPKGKTLLSHGPRLFSSTFFKPHSGLTDNTTGMMYNFRTRSNQRFSIWGAFDFVELQSPFDPTNTNKIELLTGSEHRWQSWGVNINSKPQSVFTYTFSSRYGGYYQEGTRLNLSGDLGLRFQPFVNISMSASFNEIDMIDPWGTTTFWLAGPRIDVTFTNKVYLTTFIQYNEQVDNVNINARFQWRYAPASDLFIVYTDNYFPEPYNVKNRAVVLKLTYWWNI